jgi:hypothetical protein
MIKESTHNLREVWRGYTFVMHIIPIHVLEKRMTLNLQRIIWTGSQSSSGIPSEQLQKVVSVGLHACAARQMARTFCRIDTASLGMVIGYSGSSSKMASKISSSSSPLKGDCPSNISYVSTPNAHQSTARPYRCSKRIYPSIFTTRPREWTGLLTSGAMNSGVPQKVLVVLP